MRYGLNGECLQKGWSTWLRERKRERESAKRVSKLEVSAGTRRMKDKMRGV